MWREWVSIENWFSIGSSDVVILGTMGLALVASDLSPGMVSQQIGAASLGILKPKNGASSGVLNSEVR